MDPAATKQICVDLDGTLVRTDLLWESGMRHILHSPLGLVDCLVWLLRGGAHLKLELSRRVQLDPSMLPYKGEVVDWLRAQKASGAQLMLVTAASERYARQVADYLGLFDDVLATQSAEENNCSAAKAQAINKRLDGEAWEYVGDSAKDLAVWKKASSAVAVDASKMTLTALRRSDIPVEEIVTSRPPITRSLVKELRVHQWAKNLLVLVPLLTSHLYMNPLSVVQAVLATVAFCFVASSVYLWNDLADLDADRVHSTKRNRPLAAGYLSIPLGAGLGLVFFLGGFGIALVVGWPYALGLLGYTVLTNLYSLWLKHKVIVDVTTLAILYTLRILVGCLAINVAPSIWLIAFSIFIFFSLALMKRYAELQNHKKAPARGYAPDDRGVILSLGTSSAMVAMLVLALFVDSPDVAVRYRVPQVLWLLIPPFVYWISRAWLFSARGAMHDDPVMFAVKDRVSRLVAVLLVLIVLVASVLK